MWISGHQIIDGNEIADTLARDGASWYFSGPEHFCDTSITSAKTAIFDWLINHSKLFIPYISTKRRREVMSISVQKVRVLTAFLTGHA